MGVWGMSEEDLSALKRLYLVTSDKGNPACGGLEFHATLIQEVQAGYVVQKWEPFLSKTKDPAKGDMS